MVLVLLTTLIPSAHAYTEWEIKNGSFGPIVDEIAKNARRDFIWPLEGNHNFTGCFYDGRNHRAIDIGCPKNTVVRASYEGRVIDCREDTPYFGKCIVLEHKYTLRDGKTITLYTRYKHLNSISARTKEAYSLRNDTSNPRSVISKGETIAYSGDTGAKGSFHLDFSILYGGFKVNSNDYSIDPFGNNLLEKPADFTRRGTANFDKIYYNNVVSLYSIPLCEYEHYVSSSFDEYGHCKGCGESYDYMANWDDGSCSGVYLLKAYPPEFKSTPYEASITVTNKVATQLSELNIIGSCINAFGERWYCVDYEFTDNNSTSSLKYWLSGENLGTKIRELPITIDVKITSPTGTIKAGVAHNIVGRITANTKITRISGWVENATGEIVLPKKDLNPNNTEVNLYSTIINTGLKFENLKVIGFYSFRLQVTAGSTTKNYSFPFYACDSTKPICDKPTITTNETMGGVQVVLDCKTSDTRVYYTTDGRDPTTSDALYSGQFTITESTMIKALAIRDGYNKSESSKYIPIPEAKMPEIIIQESPLGPCVTLTSAEVGGIICFSVNDEPFISVESGYQFFVTSDSKISAYTLSKGKSMSPWRINEIHISPPSIPAISVASSEIAAGEYINYLWGNDQAAGSYQVTLKRDGAVIHQGAQTENALSWETDAPGVYSLTVQAINAVGSSEESEAASVLVHAPALVRFLDADTEAVLNELSVTYGGTIPSVRQPSRRGYEFSGWNLRDSPMVSLNGYLYDTVTEDRDYIANYTPKTYTVTFLNTDGGQLVTREVEFGGAAAAPDYSTYVPNGFVFAGWTVVHADDNESLCDYTCVDSNLELQAVIRWANDELPMAVAIGNASLNAGTGYVIPVTLTNWSEAASSVWVCYALKTVNDAGVEKTVYTDREALTLQANETRSVSPAKVLDYAGNASIVEVLVLERKSDGTTGSAYSLAVSKEIIAGSSWGEWSEWSTTEPSAQAGRTVEAKMQYRYRTKETTTSTAPELSGWTLSGSSTYWSEYGPWSDWGRTGVSANEATEVETTALYRYYYYLCPKCKGHEPFKGASDCGKFNLTDDQWNAEWFPTPYSQSNSKTFSYTSAKRYTTSLGDGQIWCFSSANLNDTTIGTRDNHNSSNPVVITTGYRSRTRSELTEYSYYRWSSWSYWSDQELQPSDTVQVETRTLYRYRDELTYYVPGQEDTEGTVYSCSGSLDIDTDLSGKAATIMVYQSKNMDANQYQMKYIGQTTLGAGNTYDFSFIPASEPTADTGNYVIALGIQGTTGLLNVGLLEAPKRSYNIQFYYVDGSESVILSSQAVEEGGAAAVPEPPQRPGYTFAGWSGRSTNIISNCSIEALYVPERYALVFVDHANETVSVQTATAGTAIVPPPDPEAVGKTFLGWDVLIADPSSVVEGNTVVTAVYETSSFLIRFHDAVGTVIDSQIVNYGSAATPPAAPDVEEGHVFLGWNTSVMWWYVTSDLDVYPIVALAETTMVPISSIENGTIGLSAYLELESEPGATIYYTTDGTEPTDESTVYTEGLYLTDTTQILAMACMDGKNDSAVIEVHFLYDDAPFEEEPPARTDIMTQEIAVTPGGEYDIQVSIEDNPGLCGYLMYLDCDLSVFGLNATSMNDEVIVPGAVSEGGTISLSSDGTDGWQILWLSAEANSEDGVLFTLPIYVDEAVSGAKGAAGSYTISLSYAPLYTFSEEFEETAGDFSLTITAASSPSVLLGDVNEDGTVDADDLTALCRHVAQIELLTTVIQLTAADVNQDGSVDAADLTSLARYVAKITTSFD